MRTSLVNKIIFLFLSLMLITYLVAAFIILYQFRNVDFSGIDNQLIENIFYSGIVTISLMVLVAIILGRIMVRAISRPLEKLVIGTEKIADGDYGNKVDISTNDEIETLAESINAMSLTIQEYTAQLMEQRDNLQAVFDSIHGSLLLIDREYNILLMNANGGCFYNEDSKVKSSGCFGKCFDTFYGRDIPCKGCPVENTIASGKVSFAEVASGNNAYEVRTSPMVYSDPAGAEGRVIVYSVKVTEQVLMEKEMIQMDKLAQMGQLASGITHELKNPLSTMKAGIYYLEQLSKKDIPKYILERESRNTLESMSESLQRAEGSVHNILNFSKPSDTRKEPIILDYLLKQVLLLFSLELIKCKVNMVVDIEEDTFIGYYESNMIKNVLVHIIQNAMQAMPEGGTLTVSHTKDDSDVNMIRVTDTGIGVDPKNRKNL